LLDESWWPLPIGARMRFRAVMMTSFAFISGVYPLVVAQGAAEISRRDVGTPVFAGMIAASVVGIFVIPMLYVTFQSMREGSSAIFNGRKLHQAKPGRDHGA
jgi:Cu/Ag efflux pump CusA